MRIQKVIHSLLNVLGGLVVEAVEAAGKSCEVYYSSAGLEDRLGSVFVYFGF